jgi:hypothetical protein
VSTGEAADTLVAHIEAARGRLGALATARVDRGSAACDFGRALGVDIAGLVDDLELESPAARAAARAAAERFGSHVLAATLLEASDASPASVFELVGRGMTRLSADVDRLARVGRLPA